MGCPFAQLSPLLLVSCLVLFFQFGASFFSPKPLLASLQRGRSLSVFSCPGVGDAYQAAGFLQTPSGANYTRSCQCRMTTCSSGRKGTLFRPVGGSGNRQYRVASRFERPYLELQSDEIADEDLRGEPLPWTESLASGGPLFYSSLLRWQASALQVGLGLDRLCVPRRMDTVCNPDKQSRVRNLVYAGERVRKVRMSYLDTPGMQVYSSVAYSAPGHDFPLLSLSAMAMGSHVRVLALDLQPLFPGGEYAAKYADANAKLKAIRDKYPQMGQELVRDYYKGSPFFSDNMMYARWGPEEEASGFMEEVVMPAFQECIQVYVDIVNNAPASTTECPSEQAVLERQAEFDRFHAEREQVRPVLTSNFGASFAETYVSEFLFPYGSRNSR
ncbi:unnamed protein product [Scytosiphon promiscuus]